MLALAGWRLGLDLRFVDGSAEATTCPFGDVLRGDLRDGEVFEQFLDGVDVVTYESENLDLDLAGRIHERRLLRPGLTALATAQDRAREKAAFEAAGVRVAPWRTAEGADELRAAADALGYPLVVKTRRFGFDGRGVRVVRSAEGLADAARDLGGVPCIVEAFVPFSAEVSLLLARAASGDIVTWPLTQNCHEQGILRWSRAPGAAFAHLEEGARRAGAALAEAMDYCGVLAIEFFVRDGELWGNEMAPRVHNSGHWTQNGASLDQFEAHLRAITDLPLCSPQGREPTTMINLIGRLPGRDDPWLTSSGVHWHLYGKSPRAGRKVGHINVVGDAAHAAEGATPSLVDRIVDAYAPVHARASSVVDG